MNNKNMGVLAILLAAFMYAGFNPLVRMVGFELPFYFQNTVRNLLSVFLLTWLMLRNKGWKRMRNKDLFWVFSRGVLGSGAWACYYYSVNNLYIGTAYFTYYAMATVTGFLVGKMLFGEKFNTTKVISLVLAIIGLSLVFSVRLETPNIYLYISLLSGVLGAIWTTFSKKLADKYSAWQLIWIDGVISAIVFGGISLIVKEIWVWPGWSPAWIANYGLGFLMIITGALIIYGFNKIEVQLGSLLMLTEIVFGLGWGWFIYQEKLGVMSLIGGVLIIFGSILPQIKLRRLKS